MRLSTWLSLLWLLLLQGRCFRRRFLTVERRVDDVENLTEDAFAAAGSGIVDGGSCDVISGPAPDFEFLKWFSLT
jgi:hypothetical protein